MIDCGILSTVQSIVAVLFSFTTLLLEILEMVGWSTNNDKFKPHYKFIYQYNICITSARTSWSSNSNDISSNPFRLSKLCVQVANNILYVLISAFKYYGCTIGFVYKPGVVFPQALI